MWPASGANESLNSHKHIKRHEIGIHECVCMPVFTYVFVHNAVDELPYTVFHRLRVGENRIRFFYSQHENRCMYGASTRIDPMCRVCLCSSAATVHARLKYGLCSMFYACTCSLYIHICTGTENTPHTTQETQSQHERIMLYCIAYATHPHVFFHPCKRVHTHTQIFHYSCSYHPAPLVWNICFMFVRCRTVRSRARFAGVVGIHLEKSCICLHVRECLRACAL